MKLSEKRAIFSRNISFLVIWLNQQPGIMAAYDEVKRSVETAERYAKKGIGIRNSFHLTGLAADVLLWKNGTYQTQTPAYAEAGKMWEAMNPKNRWGGNFHDSKGRPKPDGNHFEMTP